MLADAAPATNQVSRAGTEGRGQLPETYVAKAQHSFVGRTLLLSEVTMGAMGLGLACQAACGLSHRGTAGSCPSCWQTHHHFQAFLQFMSREMDVSVQLFGQIFATLKVL